MSASITDEQFAARELVRSWAAASGAVTAARDVELGQPDAWRVAYDGLAQLGIFGVALSEEQGGADGTVEDLCAMVDEAAAAMVPGPVATTALATLMIERSDVLESLISGERVAGVALSADVRFEGGRASGTAEYVLGADPGGVLLLPAGDSVVLIDAGADGVSIEPLKATDFSRPLARVVLDSAPAEALSASPQRLADVAATVLAAEAAGLARWTLQTATDYAKVREQFGKPIGSFQAIKHMCAEMLLRSEQASVAAATQHRAVRRFRRTAAVDRRGGGRGRRDRRREGQRQGLHSGARRYRNHLGTRRASLSATRVRNRTLPRRRAPVAAPRRGAHPAGRAPRPAHRPRLGRTSPSRNRFGGS